MDCEDSLYFESLLRRFKRLDARSKAYIRLQIEQLFFQAEDNFGGDNGSRHFSTQEPSDTIIKAQFIPEADVNSLSPESGFRHHFKKLTLDIVLLCIVTKIF